MICRKKTGFPLLDFDFLLPRFYFCLDFAPQKLNKKVKISATEFNQKCNKIKLHIKIIKKLAKFNKKTAKKLAKKE